MIKARLRAIEIPGVHGDIKLLDLFPAPSSRRRAAETGQMAEIKQSRGMNVSQGELLQLRDWGSFNCNAKADQRIIHRVTAVSLSRILVRTRDGEMTEVWQLGHQIDKGRDIGGGVEYRRVLLGEDVT